jgi:hypothetical protein
LKVTINKLPYDIKNYICLIDKKIYNSLGISEKEMYCIHLGQRKVFCKIEPSKYEDKNMYASELIFKELLLYNKISLNIWRKSTDIYLGPVVGMFVPARFISAIENNRIPISAVEHIKEAAPYANCLSYCFCADNVNFKDNNIKGYTFIESENKWKQLYFCMPDVVYDRAANLSKVEKNKAYERRNAFEDNPNMCFINSWGSLGKWPLYKKLCQYVDIRCYLPETILYTGFKDVISMLKKHGFIFFKSSNGSRGEEVMSITKVKEGYRLDYYDDELKTASTGKIRELKSFIEEFVIDKKANGRETFIVQQGINLIKYHGHNMDFRLDMAKNAYGEWEVPNFYGIHSKDNSTITNMCVGGVCNTYENIYLELQNQNPGIKIISRNEFASIAIKVARSIEKAFGPFGELGIDMAMDKDGGIWFIEANARPDKSREPGIDNMEGIAPQALAIYEYSMYLKKHKLMPQS